MLAEEEFDRAHVAKHRVRHWDEAGDRLTREQGTGPGPAAQRVWNLVVL